MKEKKFLLIEDDQDHADLIIDILETEDINNKVILKTDGQEAMDYFQKGSIDCDGDDAIQSQIALVILDLNLPKVSGMDILKFLKRNPKYSSIPVVILSTSSDNDTIAKALKSGANDFLSKPADYEAFVEKIKTLKNYCVKE